MKLWQLAVGARRSAHAGDNLVLSQNPDVIAGSVLHTTIGVVHQASWRLPLGKCVLQGSDWQPRRKYSL